MSDKTSLEKSKMEKEPVLMTEPELLFIFKSIIETDEYAGIKMEYILKLLRITKWIDRA